MAKLNVIGVDLAKNVFQACILSPSNKLLMNKMFRRNKFSQFLAKQPPGLVVFEACSSAHYWSWVAQSHGHQTKIIPPKSVIPFRQGHKTDENDALAVALASQSPKMKFAPTKTPEQLGAQMLDRTRSQLVGEKTALSNHLRSVVAEFGLVFPKGFAHLKQHIPAILEDAENNFPDMLRPGVALLFDRFLQLEEDCQELGYQVEQLARQLDPCQRLQHLEGIGPIGANLLYATLGSGEAFKSGREASAYVGLTPKQHSSGGKTVMLGIAPRGNTRLRSVLIQGARSVVHKLKDPKTPKEHWLHDLIKRVGHGKAAVALANKNVRTAWAMLTTGHDYDQMISGLRA